MLYKREGMPEENEIVICEVTAVNPSSVFCNLEEYDKTGLIHISEVSPGRIRNIRDYVSEGRKVVCLVLRVDKEKGHIDLSLRRVTESQRRKKLAALKQEARAESIIDQAAHLLKIKKEDLYKKIAPAILEEYEYIHEAFDEIVEGTASLKDVKIDKKIVDVLEKLVVEKIKPKEVSIEGKMTVITYDGKGVDIIKTTLQDELKKHKNITITYLGGGAYNLVVTAPEYKDAEKTLKETLEEVKKKIIKTEGGEFSFARA